MNLPMQSHATQWILFCCCLLSLVFSTPISADERPPVSYRVSFDHVQAHYVDVEMSIVPPEAGDIELFMPVWTPGSYLVREYAQHLDRVTATDHEDKSLQVDKLTKNRWKIEYSGDKPVQVNYRIYCNELSVRTNFADSDFAILNGAATFLTLKAYIEEPHRVDLDLPTAWKTSVTALPRDSVEPAHRYMAENFDQLVDSPILLGNPTIQPFEVGGATHYLVNQGGGPLWNAAEAAADTAKIVAEHQRMWGTVPYERYYFLNLVAESGGGLEHDNSTVLLTSRWSFRDPRSYQRWLGLVSHEFFHTWNVRRLRPRGLSSYDYEVENYFDELWVAEGITSYYDDLALARASLNSPEEYLSALSRQITTLQTTPGRRRQSLDESSHDTWIKFYRSNENSRNTTISYYNKGAVVAFLFDIQVRMATNNSRSLDDVMRQLYDQFGNGRGYTNQDVLDTASEISGKDLSAWYGQAIESTDELDYEQALEWLGLKFKQPSDASESNAPWIGIATSSGGGRVTVSRVIEGSPAFEAGINVDDELIGLEGFRLSGSFDDRLKQFAEQDAVRVLLARRGELLELSVDLKESPRSNWSLERVEEPSQQQQANFADWLRLDPPPSDSTQ